MAFQRVCPVDFVAINGNRVRVTALFVFLLSVGYLFTQSLIIPVFLVIDFYLRAFYNGRFSLLQWTSIQIEKRGWLNVKWTDRAPKRFAAQLGFLVTSMLFIFAMVELKMLVFWIGTSLVLFSFLESFFGICVGCYIYTVYSKFFQTNKQAN
ncbi:MAG: CDP-alcohol phosphatidyltransferase [Chitinophagaceae bacterium]|nr:MAG: CDP-alcohol phosphatidyltransferase [Chitinophagaceae bacterium]